MCMLCVCVYIMYVYIVCTCVCMLCVCCVHMYVCVYINRMTTRNGMKTVTLEELMNNISEEQTEQSQQMYSD